MATVNKDFKIKSGLIVEGTTATVNGYDILTKKQADQDFIVDIIGGETLVKSVSNEFDVSVAGELSIDRAVVDAYYDAAGDAAAVASDLTDHENATEAHGATGAVVGTTNAQTLTNKTISYADNTLTVQVANVSDLTASAAELNTLDGITASTAELNLLDGVTATTAELNYVDGVTSGIQGQLDDKAPLASPALSGVPTAPTATAGTNNTQIATTAYADAAVAALVNGAPDLLNTLNELAEAIGDDANFATTVAGLVADKQDTLTAGNNIDITGATISVTGLDTADVAEDASRLYFTNQRALDATSAAYDIAGAAAQALADAEAYADDLDTDDIAEGLTNQYFTDVRAKASAGDLLAGATTSNVDISYVGGVLSITAENGVADSTTADLAEDPSATTSSGTMYFTDARVTTAIANATHIAPQAIDITWVRREEATWTDVATASKATCHSATTSEGSMKYLVRVTASVGGTRHSHVTEVLATVDGANGVAVVEYGTIYTSTEPLATVTVEWNAGTSKYDLNVTTANNNSEVMVAATLMATLD
jgi:hypothetical protein